MYVFSFKHRWRATKPKDSAGVRPPFATGLTCLLCPSNGCSSRRSSVWSADTSRGVALCTTRARLAVAVVGFIKGKSAIHLARVYGERKRNFVGQHFWARGYFVSTVGRDEAVIREYIKNQEKEDERLDQLGLWR